MLDSYENPFVSYKSTKEGNTIDMGLIKQESLANAKVARDSFARQKRILT